MNYEGRRFKTLRDAKKFQTDMKYYNYSIYNIRPRKTVSGKPRVYRYFVGNRVQWLAFQGS